MTESIDKRLESFFARVCADRDVCAARGWDGLLKRARNLHEHTLNLYFVVMGGQFDEDAAEKDVSRLEKLADKLEKDMEEMTHESE